jgi:hypothetical protein
MQPNDILMKKWCFGMGRSKVREEAVMKMVNSKLIEHTLNIVPSSSK